MYQFVHVESYSRSAPKTAEHKNKKTGKSSGKQGRSVKYIVDEASRQPEACPHVEAPLPPVLLHGESLDALESTCQEWAESVTDAQGRKLRKDGLCLLAGVVSAPNDIEPEAWEAFKTASVEWLKDKYGGCLKTVIEHVDESHPHLHFYVVPEKGQRFETVHEGRAASSDVKLQGGVKGLQNQAYKDAMRGFQDDFYEKVGIEHGFTRIGPAKRRLTRQEWKLEQIQAAASARAIALADEKMKVSTAESAKILEQAHGGADSIKNTAVEEARALKSAAEAEHDQVINKARSEAVELARKTMAKADEIEREAEKKGINKGLDQIEKMPWFQRVKAVIGRAVGQRDKYKEDLENVTAERDAIKAESETWTSRAKRYFKRSNALESRVKELEPALSAAERKAMEADKLKEKNEELADGLSRAKGRIQHLEAVYVPETPQAPEKAPERRRQRDRDDELTL